MQGKKIKMYITMIIFILIIIGVGYLVYININYEENDIKEIIPEIEVTDEQVRQTVILLYFKDKNKDDIAAEIRMIDSKELLENPYKYLITLLIEGPKDENLERIISENTTINNLEIKNGEIILDLLNKNINEEQAEDNEKNLIVKSIVKTLEQLNEIRKITILINGKEYFDTRNEI